MCLHHLYSYVIVEDAARKKGMGLYCVITGYIGLVGGILGDTCAKLMISESRMSMKTFGVSV